METAVQDIINRRVERGLADLLLDMYHAGYCSGARLPLELPAEAGAADLVLLVEARHRVEIREMRGWTALDDPPPDDPKLTSDARLDWLRQQPQQADPVRLLALLERENALGDATPPLKHS